MNSSFEFIPLEEMHLRTLRCWFQEPHVAEFWQEPEDEEEFRTKYLSILKSRGISSYLIHCDARPIGYIQSYPANEVGGGWWPQEPEGTYGIDQFIGEKDFINKGHGSQIIKAFTDELFKDPRVTVIIADPEPTNLRAIRAYEKVGFTKRGLMTTPNGEAMIMRLGRPQCSSVP